MEALGVVKQSKASDKEAVISELNLDIRYRLGRKKSNADALSSSPVEAGADDSESETDHSVMWVAAEGSPVVTVPKEIDKRTSKQR